MMPSRILLLSPHPDDIAWSLGGLVAHLRRTGAVMFAVTFFGRTRYAPGSPAHGTSAATQVRGVEEDTWAALTGVRADRGDLPDASLRGYDDDTEMGADPDPEIVQATTDRLRGALTLVRPHLTLAPLAVGGHVDHRAVRLAVAALLPHLAPGLLWYEDLPYAEAAGVAGASRVAPAGHPVVIDVSADWQAKEAGVRCFPSQLPQSVLPVLRRHAAAVAAREAVARGAVARGAVARGAVARGAVARGAAERVTAQHETEQRPGPARAERLWAATLAARQRLSVLADGEQVANPGNRPPASPSRHSIADHRPASGKERAPVQTPTQNPPAAQTQDSGAITGQNGQPGPGLALSEEAVFADFASRVRLRGAVIAEIGGAFPTPLMESHGVAKWYSIDPHRAAGSFGTNGLHQVLTARAEQMPLPDESVDAVFSSNAFQFLDVAATLAQARRVLRPGGLLFAHFGPIWSGADGHQLEYVRYRGRDLAFWRDTLLPPYAHLAYDRDELSALLRSGLPADLADLLVHHVHDSDTINRLFFEDYVAAALGSGLQWSEVAASAHLDYEIVPPALDADLLRSVPVEDLAAAVSARVGRPTQIGIRDVLMVLRQPGAVPGAAVNETGIASTK